MKYGYDLHTLYSQGKEPRPMVDLWRQPYHRWLWAAIYHRYDMLVVKIPGFRQLERWFADRHPLSWDDGSDDLYIPWSNRQDIRCYFLREKGREVLVTLEITQDQYDQLVPGVL